MARAFAAVLVRNCEAVRLAVRAVLAAGCDVQALPGFLLYEPDAVHLPAGFSSGHWGKPHPSRHPRASLPPFPRYASMRVAPRSGVAVCTTALRA